MKLSEFKAYLREEIIEILSEESAADIEAKADAQAELNKELEKTKELSADLTEDEDEPSMSDLKGASKDSVTKIANKLGETTKLMKSLAKAYKNAEGADKEKLVNRLKELTKIKKELEALL